MFFNIFVPMQTSHNQPLFIYISVPMQTSHILLLDTRIFASPNAKSRILIFQQVESDSYK